MGGIMPKRILSLFRNLFRKGAVERSLDDELRSSLELLTQEKMKQGLSQPVARREALIELGGIEQVKEQVRAAWAGRFLEEFARDIRFAFRTLAKSPGFTTVAVLTLALGIGATTAIFTVENGLFLHPAGVPDVAQVVVQRVKYDKFSLKSFIVSAPDFVLIEQRRDLFSSAALDDPYASDFNYSSGEFPQHLVGATVTWQWFRVFRATPLLGRTFTKQEDQPGANHEVVLAYDAWERWFGGDPGIVGRSIRLNDQYYHVIGVMRPGFGWPSHVALWTPLGLPPAAFAVGNTFSEEYLAVARLAPKVSLARASAALALIERRVINSPATSYARTSGWGMFILPLARFVYGDLQTPLLILAGAVGFVLLIACANITGLLLARAAGRSRELAIRAALGASRRRLVRQMLTETLLMAIAGGMIGAVLAKLGIRALAAIAPENLMPGAAFPMDGRVLLFALGAVILSAIVAGTVPAWTAARADAYSGLKEGSRSASAGRSSGKLRSALVVGELALGLILLTGTGLLLESLSKLSHINPGFQPRGVITAAVALPRVKYNAPQKRVVFFRSVVDRLSATPAVTAAGAGFPLPFSGSNVTGSFEIEGRPVAPGNPGPWGGRRFITPGYFRTLGIRLLQGRTFSVEDRMDTQRVAVIDKALARRYWTNQDPVGQRIRQGSGQPWVTIIGVVADVRFSQLAGAEQSSEGVQSSESGVVYYSIYQVPRPVVFFLARTAGDPVALAGAMRRAVRDVDAEQPVYDLRPMRQLVWASMGPQRFSLTLLGVFAAIALVLASVGLYGVISYGVAQRRHEIGIRMALGAQKRDVLGLVLGQGMVLALLGVGIGIAGALVLTRFLSSLLYGIKATDPLTFIAVSLILIGVALLACYVPARRATKVDPIVALRYE
jgi:predicted permease